MSNRRRNALGSFWVGAIIIVVGTFLLLDKMDAFYFPRWIFSIGTGFIVLSLIIGIRKKFSGIGWVVLMFMGLFFLLREIPEIPREYRSYIFPVGVITVGLFVLGRSMLSSGAREARKNGWEESDGLIVSDEGGDNFFDQTTIFGSNKRRIFSKEFKGGQTTCIFGGTDIDLTQADIDGTVVIDVVQLFGGVKLIIPANWEVKSDVTAVFGGLEDKRAVTASSGSNKKLVITGFVMFGGVDIKSY